MVTLAAKDPVGGLATAAKSMMYSQVPLQKTNTQCECMGPSLPQGVKLPVWQATARHQGTAGGWAVSSAEVETFTKIDKVMSDNPVPYFFQVSLRSCLVENQLLLPDRPGHSLGALGGWLGGDVAGQEPIGQHLILHRVPQTL